MATALTAKAPTAAALVQQFHRGQTTAERTITRSLEQIRALDPQINSFTQILEAAALAQAQQLDRSWSQGTQILQSQALALAGVPFAVKNLFDVAGLATLAGSRIGAEQPAARQDATAIARLKAAGAILVGTLNMDEYAYGFVTENAHYGPTHNPHDLSRIAGGSSGGSAAAVAAGLVPFALGSDTNGSIRVPAALCGIYGLKPTYGRVSRAGTFPLSSSLDHVGPLARSPQDLALVFDQLQGSDPRDPVCCDRTGEDSGNDSSNDSSNDPARLCLPQLSQAEQDGAKLRLAVAGGYFQQGALPAALEAVRRVAATLGVTAEVEFPKPDLARAAAFIITAAEGGQLHLENLRQRPEEFDPATRDRFLAGALLPSAWYLKAQQFRRWYRDRVKLLFEQVDVVLTPTTPCPAPRIGQFSVRINGEEIAVRPHLGLYTQPISFIGLPALSLPVWLEDETLPLGVQLVAAPNQEAKLLQVAARWEARASKINPR